MKKTRLYLLSLLTVPALALTGCFNLDEQAYSEIVQESFVPRDQDVAALLASSYSELGTFFDWYGMFDVQEEPADVVITPVRPNGWDDGGVYQRMHAHTWKDEDTGSPDVLYSTCYTGINNANRVLDQVIDGSLPCGDLTDYIIDELHAIRALWYAILLDNFGNVPIVTTFASDSLPEQISRKGVYNYVVKEFKDVIDHKVLSEENSASTYGRLNLWGVKMALMRVYLNAEVYTGTPAYDKALEVALDVINNGPYSLSADYSDNFKSDVGPSNTEIIFAIPYSATYETGSHVFCQGMKWFPPTEGAAHFGYSFQTWGGSCGNPQFINSYQPGDLRKDKTWLHGQQMCKDSPSEIAWTCLNYLPSISGAQGTNSFLSVDFGCRENKYEVDVDAANGNQWDNDFAWFRLAEAYYTAAECLLRGATASGALQPEDYVNAVRARSMETGVSTLTKADLEADTKMVYGLVPWGDLTKEIYDECYTSHDWSAYMDQLEASQGNENVSSKGKDKDVLALGGMYDEWGWEFALEGQRRQQMIRFGTFTTRNWYNHSALSDTHTALFPIPKSVLNTNLKLGQNPGYVSSNGNMAADMVLAEFTE